MRLIIAGGRAYTDYPRLATVAKEILHGLKRKDIEIISGTCRGADRTGELFAQSHQLHLTQFPADWERFGRKAGYLRNKQMAEYAQQSNGYLLAFWNGLSEHSGTLLMIKLAEQYGLESRVELF